MLAATSEEFLFRLFAIPFLKKLTKSTLIAVILPAFSWGFLHTAYPNEPPYIRGLEVGLIGIVAGIVMLRWGILATLVWHYTVDASLVGLLLIRSSSWYFRISGVVIGLAVLIPFGIGVYARLRRGAFEEDADLLNAATPVINTLELPIAPAAAEPAAPATNAERGYAPLSSGMIGFLCICMVLGGLAAWKLKPVHLGDYLRVQINAKEATARANDILRQQKVDVRNYRTATIFVDVTDGTASEYLREKIGVRALNDIYEKRVPGALWHVRFFRDSEPEEYSVVLLPNGSLHSIHHQIKEAAPGASLSKDDAEAKAQDFLRREKNIDLSQWTLVEATSEKKPQRLDHKLLWQENRPLDDLQAAPAADAANHAYARMQIFVVGDEVTSYRTLIKIPEDWRRKHEEQSVARTVFNYLPLLFVFGFGGAVLVLFLREIKSDLMKAIPWRQFAVWGLVGLAGYALVSAFGNRVAQALSQYQTAMPLKFLLGALGIGFLVGAFFYLGAIVLVFAIAWFFLRQAFGNQQFPGWQGMPGNYYRDALIIGLAGTAALLAVRRVSEWVAMQWPTAHQALGAAFGSDFDSRLPAIAISATTVLRGLLFTGLIALVAGFIAARCESPAFRALLFVMASLAMAGGWGSPADLVKQWIASAVFLAVVVFGVVRVVRWNLLGYFLVLAISSLMLGCVELLAQPNGFYRAQGVACAAALGVLLVWPMAAWMTAKSIAPASQAP